MTVWRTSWRQPGYESHEQHEDHPSEAAAMRHAQKLARKNVMALVYPIEEVDGE